MLFLFYVVVTGLITFGAIFALNSAASRATRSTQATNAERY
jgi:hypothetical protein